jgi:hypothetical protein
MSRIENGLILPLLVLSAGCFGQEIAFEVIPNISNVPYYTTEFNPTISSEIRAFDFDNDGDLDILGGDRTEDTYYGFIGLYENDGGGNFRKLEDNPFLQVEEAFADVADIDQDGDLDVLISGRSINIPQTTLYRNECGVFTIDQQSVFIGYENGRIAFADIDNDSDQDVVLSGVTASGVDNTRIYKNDGQGVFTLFNTTSLPVCYYGSIDFADIDNDSDSDVLMTGQVGSGAYYASMFLNDGLGNFTLQSPSPFPPVRNSNVEFGDVDNDGDLDVFVMGISSSSAYYTRMYANNGSGVFSYVAQPALTTMAFGNLQLADVDNDNDLDLFIAGSNATSKSCKLYRNDGTGAYTYTTGNSYNWANGMAMDVVDINNNGWKDLITIGGKINSFIHVNNGAGVLTSVPNSPLTRVSYSASDIGDIDGDNDLDLLISGESYAPGATSPYPLTSMYTNNGTGNYTVATGTPFQNMQNGDIEFADVDNDGDLDAFLCGATINLSIKAAKLYLNNGLGTYTLSPATFEGLSYSSAAFGDIDGDLDLDLVVSGSAASNIASTKLYLNNGLGAFTEQVSFPVVDVKESHIDFADLDGDLDLDLFITGIDQGNLYHSKIYLNSNGVFNLLPGTPFPGLKGPFGLGDLDGDNDVDIFLTGENTSGMTSGFYLNQGAGVFSLSPNGFPAFSNGAVKLYDADQDSDLDLFVCGGSNFSKVANLYLNNGTGTFTLTENMPFMGVNYGDVSVGDVNNDQRTDLVLTGMGPYSIGEFSQIYLRKNCKTQVYEQTVSSCSAYLSNSGVLYTTDGIYYEEFSGANGCDSIIRYCVNILGNNAPTQSVVSACDEYTSNAGQTYTSSGIFTETYNNLFGCDSTVVLDLTIQYSSSSTATINACSSFTTPQGNTYTSSGNYTESIVNSVGCDSIIQWNITIETLNTNVNLNGNILSSEQISGNYQWIDCANGLSITNATGSTYTPTISGDYAVITFGAVCNDTSDCISVNISTLSEQPTDRTIFVYPNPASDFLFIKAPNTYISSPIALYNMQGKLLQTGILTAESTTLRLPYLAAGMYLLKVGQEQFQVILE